MQTPELHRRIRATFGFVLVLVSLWLPWGEGRSTNWYGPLRLPHESHGIARGVDAFLDAGGMTIPLWIVAVSTGWLLAMSWLQQFRLLKTNAFLVFLLHGSSLALLFSWLVKLSEYHAYIGIGFPICSVGVLFTLRAVQIDFEEAPVPKKSAVSEVKVEGQT